MTMWADLVRDTLVRPRSAARRVLGLNIGLATLLEAAVAISCLGMVLGYLAFSHSPGAVDALTAAVLGNPLVGAAVQLAAMALIVVLVVRVGRLFGGYGDVWGALMIVVWLNGIMVLLQALQLAAMVLFAPVAVLIALASFIWAVWAFASFVGELHGFSNTVAVLGGVLLTMTGVFLAVAILLAALGLSPEGTG
jgi:hypothetical protein